MLDKPEEYKILIFLLCTSLTDLLQPRQGLYRFAVNDVLMQLLQSYGLENNQYLRI